MNKSLVAIILRGVSGSGKSSVAEYLRSLCPSGECIVCTADDYFYKDGKYDFRAEELRLAHNSCFEKFRDAVDGRAPLVICANTNTKPSEFDKYVDYAKENGYIVISLIAENRHGGKSAHNVPDFAIKKQENNLRNNIKLV
mgnify:CR=1 FL=1